MNLTDQHLPNMSFTVLLLAHLVSLTYNPVSTQLISLETNSIRNKMYVVSNDWGEIPVDATGEDVNSDFYGGVFERADLTRNYVETRVSIAKNQMELKIDLKNNTKNNYILEGISLDITGVYDLKDIDFDEGKWNIGLSQEFGTPRNFTIDSSSESIIINEQRKIRPAGEDDPRFKLLISAKGSPSQKNVMLRFSIRFKVSTTDLNIKTFEINSDKDYFIAIL